MFAITLYFRSTSPHDGIKQKQILMMDLGQAQHIPQS